MRRSMGAASYSETLWVKGTGSAGNTAEKAVINCYYWEARRGLGIFEDDILSKSMRQR